MPSPQDRQALSVPEEAVRKVVAVYALKLPGGGAIDPEKQARAALISARPHLATDEPLDQKTLNTIWVALEEWGAANCNRDDFTECGDPFCRDFADALARIRTKLGEGPDAN